MTVISSCGTYRYRLTRQLGEGAGTCCFVMLNPSTADASIDDPTIRRCMGYARSFGCAELLVVNLFAYRATDPRVLYAMAPDRAVGPDNDAYIRDACDAAQLVICAWGNHGAHASRAQKVLTLIRQQGVRPMALKINAATGQPAHPLYLKATLQPIEIERS